MIASCRLDLESVFFTLRLHWLEYSSLNYYYVGYSNEHLTLILKKKKKLNKINSEENKLPLIRFVINIIMISYSKHVLNNLAEAVGCLCPVCASVSVVFLCL